jgi:hypothetical protein
VLSLACVPFRIDENKSFEEYVKDGFSVKFDKREQRDKYRRTVDKSTIDWWKKQSSEARAVYEDSDEDMTMEDGLIELSKYLHESEYRFDDRKSFVFCRGNYFDFPMIESMYQQIGKNLPFNTWAIRDIRTFVDVLTGSTDGYGKYKNLNIPGFIAHNCLHDTCADIIRMKTVYQDVFGED